MDVINIEFIRELIHKAEKTDRMRAAYDLRNSPEDNSQRILNALMPGTDVPIHRHEGSSETTICIYGRVSVYFYEQKPDSSFIQTEMVSLDPSCGRYGIQIPKGAWHTVKVVFPSLLCEVKDGKYEPQK